MRYRMAVTVSGLAISSYFAGKGPKYRNCCFRTSNPYSSWPYGTVRGRKRLKLPPQIRLMSCKFEMRNQVSQFVFRERFEHTAVPNDQMSVPVFHGVSIITSGLVHIGAPIGVPSLAYFESEGYVPPGSYSWTSENRISPSVQFTKILSSFTSINLN